VDIRLPTQSLFLSGESPEVDNLVKRARPIDGADPRSRALVPQPVLPTDVAPSPTRAVYVPETQVDYEAATANLPPRVRTPADLYRQVNDAARPDHNPRYVDVFA
jgi:hypothetical protein